MNRRVFAIFAAIVLVLSGVQPVAASYYNGCAAPGGLTPTWHVLRIVPGRQYNYSIGTTIVRLLHSCSPANGYDHSPA